MIRIIGGMIAGAVLVCGALAESLEPGNNLLNIHSTSSFTEHTAGYHSHIARQGVSAGKPVNAYTVEAGLMNKNPDRKSFVYMKGLALLIVPPLTLVFVLGILWRFTVSRY